MSISLPSLGTNATTTSGVDQLVAMYVQSISTPVYNMEAQVSQINSLISVYQSLKSKLADLQTQASSLSQPGTLSPSPPKRQLRLTVRS